MKLVRISPEYNGKPLTFALAKMGCFVDLPCGGTGRCGRCTVLVKIGDEFVKRRACREIVGKDGAIVQIPDELLIEDTEKTSKNGMTAENIENSYLNGSEADMAIDIGTTTIEAALVQKGKILKTKTALNPGKIHGADVLSRISFAENEEGLKLLSGELFAGVKKLAEGLLAESSGNYKINNVFVCANPTIAHIFAGISPKSIGVYPFLPEFSDVLVLEKNLCGEKKLCILPASSDGFIGSDALCGAFAVGLSDGEIILDLGTNGEILLKNDGKYYGTSTAAGPCFEGANISSGMGGTRGAICNFTEQNGAFFFKTIENTRPVGVCGAGLVDIIGTFIKNGTIEKDGYCEDDIEISGIWQGGNAPGKVDTGILITKEDIRALQLAKAAIKTAAEALLKKSGIEASQLKKIYISGGLGKYINLENAAKIGLVPKDCLGKTEAVGNAALLGAIKATENFDLFNEKIGEIKQKLQVLPLSLENDFQQDFIKNIDF